VPDEAEDEEPDIHGEWHSEDLFPFRFPQGSPLAAIRRSRAAQESGSIQLWPPVEGMARLVPDRPESSRAEQDDYRGRESLRDSAEVAELEEPLGSRSSRPATLQDSDLIRGREVSNQSSSTASPGTDVARGLDQREVPVRGTSRALMNAVRQETPAARASVSQGRQQTSNGSRAPNGTSERVRTSNRQSDPLPARGLARVGGALVSSTRPPSSAAREGTATSRATGSGITSTSAAPQVSTTRDARRSRSSAGR